ncbi:hypothetical protein HY639_04270 [Candidatus Woesearchaeota archaeon]|nr:hypothetical protein [Candidatus Woesearchaeota archaeon]
MTTNKCLPDYLRRLERNALTVGGVSISFQRTCRVPEGRLNSLPAGLGAFSLYAVHDFKRGTPQHWRDDAYFMPMYPQEAMWMNFSAFAPRAMIVGAGNINAISGKPFQQEMSVSLPTVCPCMMTPCPHLSARGVSLDVGLQKDQNYLVVPPQPWLDGWKAEDGKVYQFVAAELGSGQTVEAQVTNQEKAGGIQFVVYEAAKALPPVHRPRVHPLGYESLGKGMVRCMAAAPREMGLGRGGEIEQKVYPDPYGVDVWKAQPVGVELVYLISSHDFKQVTGHEAPETPVTYEKYQQLGLPWFQLWDKHFADAKGSDVFGKLKPIGSDPLDKLKPKK